MKRAKNAEYDAQRKASGAAPMPRSGHASPGHRDNDAPLSARALDYEGRIADLQQKIRELDESRATLASQLRALATKEEQIEHIHHSWVEIFDAIVDPIFMHDRQGRILRANRAYADMAGMDIRQVIGRLYWQVFPLHDGPFPACTQTLSEHRETAEEDIVLETGQAYRCRYFTLLDPDGVYLASLHIMQNVTELKAAGDALRDSEARFRALIENSSDITTLLDRDGIARYTSPSIERMLGYGDEELVGQNILALVHPDDLPEVRSALTHAVENPGLVQHVEHRFKGKDGVWRYLESVGKYFLDDSPVSGIVVNSRDIGARKLADAKMREADESLRKVNRALKTLSACNVSLVHAKDEHELLNAICEVIVRTGGYRFAWVGYAARDEGKPVRPMAHAGEEAGFLHARRFSWDDNDDAGRGPVGMAIRAGTPQGSRNIQSDPGFLPHREEALSRGYASYIVLPLRAGDGAQGVLAIYATEADAFDEGEVKLLMELADDLAYGIVALRTRVEREHAMEESRQNAAKLSKTLLETIGTIGSALEKRDPYTAGHQRQVAKLAHAIAQEMKLAPEVVEGIYMGGLIHDVGKIYVPAEILSRPGRLSEPEFNLVKAHPQVGYDIVKGIDFPWPVAQMILQHHERLNGSGYPQGLKGDEICLEARILAVADVVEAMASHRPYRPGLGTDKALEEISRNRGILYDAQAVDVCLSLFREKGFTFE